MSKNTATPSVIARLMGLDELQSQQAVNKQRKQQRVLSENYLRKVASIGAWEKRLFNERHSFRFSIEEQKEFKVAFEVIESLDFRSPRERMHIRGPNHIEKPDYMITDQEGVPSQENPKLFQELENGFMNDSRREYGHDGTSMVPRFHLESSNERWPSSRKIVILKPKSGEAETDKNNKGFLGRGKGNLHTQVKERKNFPDDVKSTGCRSIHSSETEVSFEPPRLGFSDAQGLTNEPEFMMVSSRSNSDVNNWYKPLCHDLDGSYVAQEAKKQISERWRMNKEFRENGPSFGGRGRSRTLGEMLALSDHAKRATFRGPLGISSRDGWKNGGNGDLIKSRSQVYSTSVRSPIIRTTPKAFHVDSYMTMRPVFPWSRRKWVKQGSNGKDCPKQRNSGSKCKQYPSSPDRESQKNHLPKDKPVINNTYEENDLEKQDPESLKRGIIHSSSENEIIPINQWNNIKGRKMSTEDYPESSTYSPASRTIVPDVVVVVETTDAGKSTQNHNEHRFEPMDCTISDRDHDSSFGIPDTWNQQEDISMKISEQYGTDPDFLVNLEAANQPSPVSVLEAPFMEGNLLSSKCFLSVTASLNDVKRQLEFLRSESIEDYSEGPGMVVSSDDEPDPTEDSLKECDVNEYSTKSFRIAESRDFSYLVDVLTEAGFHTRNPDILNGWHSAETPISLSVFETLEKKYGEQISWKRSARRLLFDRINLGLIEILQPCLGDPMWTKPVSRRLISYAQNLKEIEEELYMLLVSQENEAKTNSSEKVFGKDDGWLSLGYYIEAIGREIENSLIDELAAEIVSL
ncbi:hypothetical protein CXB51_025055 [Gossypium anomalum]|uniref:DUF4378 domain-containing protein n=1 Tax=Gossypium anomalum TaxID=47600 RepID=A0A8J6CS46_9ROSI|nr:hypothetical protein CXB51_025055 [Gossypium anomalum]